MPHSSSLSSEGNSFTLWYLMENGMWLTTTMAPCLLASPMASLMSSSVGRRGIFLSHLFIPRKFKWILEVVHSIPESTTTPFFRYSSLTESTSATWESVL